MPPIYPKFSGGWGPYAKKKNNNKKKMVIIKIKKFHGGLYSFTPLPPFEFASEVLSNFYLFSGLLLDKKLSPLLLQTWNTSDVVS